MKLIEIDVFDLVLSTLKNYVNKGIKKVLINPSFIAEIWPIEKISIGKKTSDVAERSMVIGYVNAARLYTLNQFYRDVNMKFITEESYNKLSKLLIELHK